MEAYLQKFLEKFSYLKIQLEEITEGTNNFKDETNRIGVGGFGKVYKGKVSRFEGDVAIKRLDPNGGQGAAEFLKEIMTLSDYEHENLISLLGFCCEGSEMILVYEHASRGSLDRYLNSPHLTWIRRLKICLDAAKGLNYLHDPRETHRRLIHCDVKSPNILLDDQWNAKVSDLGLSIMGSANEQHSVIVNLAAGTKGYIDPLYLMTHTLTKESDVYSFGVVLFEVLFGRLCCTVDNNGHVKEILVPRWKECYEEKKLNDIIFQGHNIQPLEQSALEIFSDIAYRCLKEDREDRPEMAEVVIELESALESQMWLESQDLLKIQEFKGEWNKRRVSYVEVIKSAEPPLNYRSEVEFMKLLSKGVLLNGGKTWFSLNRKGEHCEMISIAECMGSEFRNNIVKSEYGSRFAKGTYCLRRRFNASVKAHFLSPGVTYTVNLVVKFYDSDESRGCRSISLKYKLQGETESSISYLAHEREDGLWMAEMYQFTCDHKIVHLQILFDEYDINSHVEVEGIEFRPLEKMEHKEDENQHVSDSASDVNWEEKLPDDEDFKWLTDVKQFTNKEEAYSNMRKGFFININDEERQIWFYLDKNGKKCHMLSGNLVCEAYIGSMLPLPESRFGEAFQCDCGLFRLEYEIHSQLLSSETTYAIFLVYKLSKEQFGFEHPFNVTDKESKVNWYIFFVSPKTPVIEPKTDQNTHNTPTKLVNTSLPQQRNDGWMEVQILEFRSTTTAERIPTCLDCITTRMGLRAKRPNGLIIEGIEIRAI